MKSVKFEDQGSRLDSKGYPTSNNIDMLSDDSEYLLEDALDLGNFSPIDAITLYNSTTLMENVQTPGTAARSINEISLTNFINSSKFRLLPPHL